MLSWWSSVEALGRFNSWLQYAIAVFGILTAVAIVLSTVATNRIDTLRSERERQLTQRLKELQPRHLTLEQETDFVQALMTGPKGPVIVTFVLGDGEAENFAAQLKDLLARAGWPATGPEGFTGQGHGLAILGNAPTLPEYGATLKAALEAIGLPVQLYRGPMEMWPVQLLVEHKP
jgi:hypothetical protein